MVAAAIRGTRQGRLRVRLTGRPGSRRRRPPADARRSAIRRGDAVCLAAPSSSSSRGLRRSLPNHSPLERRTRSSAGGSGAEPVVAGLWTTGAEGSAMGISVLSGDGVVGRIGETSHGG